MPVHYDLNADVGEGFAFDAELLTVITSANVACGFHAGDAATMQAVCEGAAEHGVAVGAQVSYRDREGFGRREMDIAHGALAADLDEQVRVLAVIADRAGGTVTYLKPHGALYNRTVADPGQAATVAEVAARFGLPVLGLPGSRLLDHAERLGLRTLREFFADRAYDARAGLVSRAREGAVIADASVVAARVRQLVTDGSVTTIEGDTVPVGADSVCVHGDSPDALDLARAVRAALTEAGGVVRRCT